MTREISGSFDKPLRFDDGETHIEGTTTGLSVGESARVEVDGTVAGETEVRGFLFVRGTLAGPLIIAESGECILEGAVTDEVINRGKLRTDVDLIGAGRIENAETGKQVAYRGNFRRERHADGSLTHIWDS
jgi:hypothetical protein